MTYHEFKDLVAEMRDAQKNKSFDVKKLEHKVDKELSNKHWDNYLKNEGINIKD